MDLICSSTGWLKDLKHKSAEVKINVVFFSLKMYFCLQNSHAEFGGQDHKDQMDF